MAIAGLVLCTLAVSAPAMAPLHTVNCFLPSDSCASAYKSLNMKNDHGLVSEDGSLLRYDIKIDNESDKKPGLYCKMTELAAFRLLSMIQELQGELPEENQIPYHTPSSSTTIIQHLKMHKEQIGFSDEDLNDWIKEIEKLDNEYKELRANYIHIVKMQAEGNPIFNALAQRRVTVTFNPTFPFRDYYVKQHFDRIAKSNEQLTKENTIQDAKEVMKDLTPENLKELPQLFIDLRAAILKKNVKLYELLGLEAAPKSKAELRKQLHKYRFIHPDRYKDTLFEECFDEAYKCFLFAYKHYEDRL